ncbi:5923_t:CDS:1, partial [Rhizophagus irregularis]
MDEAHQKLVEIVKIIEQNYGQDMITLNLHLSLHLYKCAKNFGPLYAFWCFSFERMNGVL